MVSALSPLDRLAALHGIAAHYTDVWGADHAISADTKRVLLAAMGIDADDPDAIERALAHGLARVWQRVVQPVLALAADQPGEIPVALPADCGTVSWSLVPEHGAPTRGVEDWSTLARLDAATIEDRPFEMRALRVEGLPAGYHTLSVAAGERAASTLLVVAPA
ncbi:MAG TPA: hypothetical protein VMB81_26765, partial [Candidatus Sulfotelmatobacter sp.]|nr:hypothetical protein [Candidatus Sulfotelmatobacter sp.]